MNKRFFVLILLFLVKSGVLAAGLLTVTMLDVGQGSSIVVKSPTGKIMVVDCGTSSWKNDELVGDKVTAPYVQSLGKNNIDLAVLTHPHIDHVSGFARLLKKKPAKIVLDLGIPDTLDNYTAFMKEVKKSKAKYIKARRGQSFDIGGGVKVYVLSPNPYIKYRDLNENSIVLKIAYKFTSFILAADAGVDAEFDILSKYKNLKAQVLQVGHHGSKTSSSQNWLNTLKPTAAAISVGRNNIYNLPAKDTIAKLQNRHIKIYRTDKNGAIIFSSDGKTIRAKTILK